jgi:hypothetical protein
VLILGNLEHETSYGITARYCGGLWLEKKAELDSR